MGDYCNYCGCEAGVVDKVLTCLACGHFVDAPIAASAATDVTSDATAEADAEIEAEKEAAVEAPAPVVEAEGTVDGASK